MTSMEEQTLAKVHKGCTLHHEYCDEMEYGMGCESCRYHNWIIDEILDNETK